MAEQPALVVRKVGLEYRQLPFGSNQAAHVLTALRDVNLVLKRGSVLGLTGERKSGKSSLALCLARHVWPTTGSIERYGEVELVQRGGDGPFDLRYSARDRIEESSLEGRQFRVGAVREALRAIGFEERDCYERSDLARLAIAKGLAAIDQRPGTLVIDEICDGLPRAEQDDIMTRVRRVQAERDVTVVLISRVGGLLARVADDVAEMRSGTLIRLGTVARGAKPYGFRRFCTYQKK